MENNRTNQADSFLNQILQMVRNNGELSFQERRDIELFGTPITPRTPQEINLLINYEALEATFDPENILIEAELKTYNIENNADLSLTDYDEALTRYKDNNLFQLDRPTLYSLAKKGGMYSFNFSNGAVDGKMNFSNDDVAYSIYEELSSELELDHEMAELGIKDVNEFQLEMWRQEAASLQLSSETEQKLEEYLHKNFIKTNTLGSVYDPRNNPNYLDNVKRAVKLIEIYDDGPHFALWGLDETASGVKKASNGMVIPTGDNLLTYEKDAVQAYNSIHNFQKQEKSLTKSMSKQKSVDEIEL